MFSTPPPIHMEQTYTCNKSSSSISIFWDIKKGEATEPLKNILNLTGIPEDLPLDEIVALTQKEWLSSVERAKATDSPELTQIQPSILEQARALQMIEALEPKNNHFSSVLITGSKVLVFEKRLKTILERAITFDTLYILSGERKLDQDEIDALILMGSDATDEREMMAFITEKRIAEASSDIHFEIIKAPKKEGAPRATNVDTYKAWLASEKNPNPAPILLVSSQPYGHYQLVIAKDLLPEEIELLAIESTEKRAIIYLDTLARILYTIQSKVISQN